MVKTSGEEPPKPRRIEARFKNFDSVGLSIESCFCAWRPVSSTMIEWVEKVWRETLIICKINSLDPFHGAVSGRSRHPGAFCVAFLFDALTLDADLRT